jgi:hypothetical protein
MLIEPVVEHIKKVAASIEPECQKIEQILQKLKTEIVNQISVNFDEKISQLRSWSNEALDTIEEVIHLFKNYRQCKDETDPITEFLNSLDQRNLESDLHQKINFSAEISISNPYDELHRLVDANIVQTRLNFCEESHDETPPDSQRCGYSDDICAASVEDSPKIEQERLAQPPPISSEFCKICASRLLKDNPICYI